MTAKLWRIGRIVLALGMLSYLFVSVGHTKPLERLASTKLVFILLAIVVVIIDGLVRSWNWTQLIRAMRLAPSVSYRTVVHLQWVGAFLGQVLPSTVGTDAVRAMLASRRIGGHASAHGAAVVMLNAISLVACCAAGLACAGWMAVTQPSMRVRPVVALLFTAPIVAAACGYWLLRTQRGLLLRILRMMHGPWRKFRRGARRFMHRMLVFERYDVHPAPIFAVAFVTLVTRATVYALVGRAVGLVLPFPAWMALVPNYTLSGLIPYSVSGYGGDQAAIVYALTGFGADADAALAFALIVPLITMVYNMLGGLGLLFGRIEEAAEPGAAPVRLDGAEEQ